MVDKACKRSSFLLGMARNLLLKQQLSGSSQIGIAIGSLFLCAFALFVCATHSRKWRKWAKLRACYGYADHDPVIQLNPDRIQAYHFGDFDPSTCSGEATIWKKNIMMGGKCQLPDFSGVIIYDTDGNIVPPAKTARALTRK